MTHFATPEFWFHYRLLPEDVRALADRCFELLQNDPRHPSLRLKKVGTFWSARVGCATGLWQGIATRASSGSGSGLTLVMTNTSPNKRAATASSAPLGTNVTPGSLCRLLIV
jgi:hypothetical protein